MPITNRTNDGIITVIATDAEVSRMTDLERQAREGNFIVAQHGASLITDDEQNNKERDTTTNPKPGYLKIHKLMKLIGGGRADINYKDIPVPKEEHHNMIQMHSASTASNNTTNNNSNLIILNLMKRVVNGPRY